MKIVFIGTELNEKYPQAFGYFLTEDEQEQWVTLADVLAAIFRGESVEIRPASEDEMANAEASAVLFDIGSQLGDAYINLLNRRGRDYAANTVINMIAAVDLINANEDAASENQGQS